MSSSPSSSAEQSPAVPMLHLGQFETGGGWGLGDQFARLPPAEEQQKSHGNIYKVAPPTDRDRSGEAGLVAHHDAGGHSSTAVVAGSRVVPETTYLTGSEEDDDTFVDHGSVAHAAPLGSPPQTSGGTTRPPKFATQRPPVIKAGPPNTRLSHSLGSGNAMGAAGDGYTPLPQHAAASGSSDVLVSSSGTAPFPSATAGRLSLSPQPSSIPSQSESRLGFMRSRPAGNDSAAAGAAGEAGRRHDNAPSHGVLVAKAPADRWDPPRVVSRMTLPSAVRDLAVDPSGDRLWLAAGDAPLTVAELRDTKLQTSKSLASITQVYCMAVVEVPSGGQSVTFKSVDEKRSKKKRSSTAYEDASDAVVKNRHELWCGLSRGHIAVVDLESGTDAGLISQAHSQPVNRMWSLSNGKVWSAGRDKAVHIWNPQSRRALKTRNIAAILSHLIYIPHTRQVWATADDNIIRVYEGGGSNASLQRPGHDKNDNMVRMRSDILTLAYHEDANVVWVCMNRTTALVHPRSGEIECLLSGSVSAVAFHEKTAIAAGQGAFFQSEAMRLVVLDVTDAMRPTIMFLGSTVETVNCIGLHLFHPTPLAVIAHDEGKQGNKKHRLTVFTYAETAPLVDYSEQGAGDASRTPEQRQEAVGYRNVSPSRGQDLSLRGSTTVSPGPFLALSSPPSSSLAASGARLPSNTTQTPMSHPALSPQSSTTFAGMPHVAASASGPAAAAVAAAVAAAGPRHVNHTTTKMLSLVTTNADAVSVPRSPGHAGNVAELGNSTAVVEPAVPQRPVYRDNNPEAGIIPGPARNAEVVASLSKLEKRTEEVCGMLASTRRTEPPLADLAKLHSETSAWLITSDIPATLPAVPREETERIEKEFRTPEGRVLATIMARLRLAATHAHLKDTTEVGEGGRQSPPKQTSPQSPASSLSGNPTSGRSPPAVHLMGGGSGVQTSRDFLSSGSVLPVAVDSKYQTNDSLTGGVVAGSGGDMTALGALAALAGNGANTHNGVTVLPDGGAPALSSEAVLQWVAQLSRSAQEERRLHERQMHSLQRHNKRIAERNASLVNGMTKVCESVRNWGQRVADEADAQWARLTPQANSMEADHHRLAINIIRRAVTELDDVVTTSGPREIRNYVTRMQSCLTRIVALQEKSQQFFLSATLEARLLSSTTGPAPAQQQGVGTNDNATEKAGEPLVTTSATASGPSTASRSPWPAHDDQAGGQVRSMAPAPASQAANPSDSLNNAMRSPLAHPTTSSAMTGVSTIIEAGLAPPLAVPQLVSSITAVADKMLEKAKKLTGKWSCLSEMQRELYAQYIEAAATAAATPMRTASGDFTADALTPVPALDLVTDFTAFPVLWDLGVAYSMFELCVRESYTLILDSILNSDGVVQCVPVREEDKVDAGADDDDEDRFVEATLGTAEFTQRLVEDMRANMTRTDGLTPALQKRMLIGGLLQDYPSEAVQSETVATAATTSRKLGDLLEGLDKQGTRMRRDLHATLEDMHHTIARLQTPADLQDVEGAAALHVGEASRGELPSSSPMMAAGRTESASRTLRHPSFSSSSSLHTTSTWMHSTRPIAIFGGFLGMEQRPLVYAGRLRGGVYWGHVYLCFLEQCVEAAANVLQTGDTVMPQDNFLAMTEMIVEWRGHVETLAGECLTVRNTLSTTRSDMEDVVVALPPRIAQLATANASRLTRRYPGSDTTHPRQPQKNSTATTPNADSWMRTMRSGTRRTQGDPLLGYTSHVTNNSNGGVDGGGGGGVLGGSGSGPSLGVNSSDLVGPLAETVRNSFDLSFFSVCLRLYLHQTCTPSPSALRDARSLTDLHGCTAVPPILQSRPAGASSSQTGREETLDYLGRADGAVTLPHTSDLVESPRGAAASGEGVADAAVEKGRDAFEATQMGLEEIIASIDAILLTAQRLHATCRSLDAQATAIVEANAKWEAASEENGGSASSSTPPVVVLTTDPVVVAQLRGGTAALAASHDGAGSEGGAKTSGSGTTGEPSPHRASRHHHRKPSSSSVRGGNSSGSAKGDLKDSPGTVPADKADL